MVASAGSILPPSAGARPRVREDFTPRPSRSSSLFLYVDNEVIIAIHAGGKTRDSHAGECTVSFRALIFSRAAENGHRSLRPAYCLLDLRRSVHLIPKNRAVIEREVVVCRKRAGAFYLIGDEHKIGGSDRPVGKRG